MATVAASVCACLSPAPEDVLGSRVAPEDDWFCDGDADGQWDCVQDRQLVANPELREDRPVVALVPTEPARPERHPVLEWSAGHYAVQLIALDSDEAIAAVAERLAIPELLRVRIESGGRLFHVLLLGDYAERRDADVASAGMVGRMPSLEPWVRRVGPLQDAFRRAQQEP